MNRDLIQQYELLHRKNNGYGGAATYLSKIIGICRNSDVESALDFGCGKGMLADKMTEAGIPTSKYDPSIKEFSDVPNRQFDIVIANDVLEHLHPDCYMHDISVMLGLSKGLIFLNISCRPAVFKLPNGENCHTLIRSGEWWLDLFSSMRSLEIVYSKYHEGNQNLELLLIKN